MIFQMHGKLIVHKFYIQLFYTRIAKDMETIKKALHAENEDEDDLTSGDELVEKKEIPLNDSKSLS